LPLQKNTIGLAKKLFNTNKLKALFVKVDLSAQYFSVDCTICSSGKLSDE